MPMKPEKHGAENILSNLKKPFILLIPMISKHGSGIIIENKFAREAPCFQEFQNPRRMEKAMNI